MAPLTKEQLQKEFIEQVMASQGIIHKVCGMYCDDEEDRRDLFQEILIHLWKSYPSFRGEAKFSTWMYRVGLNVAIQHFRKSKKKKEDTVLPESFDDMPHIEADDIPEEEIRLLHKAIGQLNDVEKAIVMLYLEEVPDDEIADIIGISQNYVRVKMTRIKAKLKKIANPVEDGTK